MLQGMSLPSVVFEPTFRGAIRNVIYGEAGEEKVQEMMAYKVTCVNERYAKFRNTRLDT